MSTSPLVRQGLRSLRVQLWLWIALPAAIGLLALSLVELYAHERAMHQLLSTRAQDQTQSVAALLDVQIARWQDELINLADGMPVALMPRASSLFPGGLAFYNAQNQPVVINQAPWATNPELAPLIVRARAGARAASHSDPTRANAPLLLFLAVAGHNGAVLVGALPVNDLFQSSLVRLAPLDPSAQLALLADGMVVATVDQDGAVTEPLLTPTIQAEAEITTIHWHIQLNQPRATIFSPLLRIGSTVGAVIIVAVLISGLAAYFGLRYLVRPLQRLNTAAMQASWGDGDLLHQPVKGVTEIEELRLALMRMTEQVERYQNQLHSYIDAMTLGQEEERKRLSHELHDETVQTLIALNQQIELAERELVDTPAAAGQRLRLLHPLVTDTIAGLRRQIQALRPMYLEDLGFVPALEALVRQITQPAGIVGDFEVTGEPAPVSSPALEITAFRIAQEAIHNAVVHAHATWVHVELSFQSTGFTICIEDDGIGFMVPTHPFLLAQQGHFGLLGMHERTQAHGGRLHLQSEPGKGTKIEFWLPYQTGQQTNDQPALETAYPGTE